MKRCGKCEKSTHYKCQKGSCECKCRTMSDITSTRDTASRLSDPANDEFIEELNKKFRELQNPVGEQNG